MVLIEVAVRNRKQKFKKQEIENRMTEAKKEGSANNTRTQYTLI